MTEPVATNGPGPVIHGPHRTQPGVFVIQLPNGELATGTQTDIATIPIAHQWFTGTRNGLIASWPTRTIAEDQATQRGTLLGQIAPITTTELRKFLDESDATPIEPSDEQPIVAKFVMLLNPNGQPLHGQ